MTQTSADPGASETEMPTPPPADEPVDLVPAWLRGHGRALRLLIRRRLPDRLGLAAGVLGVVSFGPLLALLVRGSFYIDDLRAETYAAGRSYWPFVIQSNGTHLAPGARSLDWLQVTFAPLDHGVAVAISLLIRALLLLGTWRLLTLVFGRRWILLVPYVLVATTPALVPVTAWYRQSITSLVAAVALVWATDQHVRWLQDRRTRHLAGSVLWIAAGLAFDEQSAAIPVWLFALTLTLAPFPVRDGHVRRGRFALMLRAWQAWVAYSVLLGGFLIGYAVGPYDHAGQGGAVTPRLITSMAGHHVLDGLAPGLLGGPWRWQETSPYYGIAHAPRGLAIAAVSVFVAAFAWAAVRRWRRALSALFLLAVGYAAMAAPVIAGRLPVIGTVVGLEYRFWAVLVVPVYLCVLLALLPTQWEKRPPQPAATRRRGTRVLVRVAAGGLALAVVVGTAISTVRFDDLWHQNPTDQYLATLRTSLDHLPKDVALLPTSPTPTVMPGWVQPGYDTRDLAAPLDNNRDAYGTSGRSVVDDGHGRLVAPVFRRLVGSGDGPVKGCGWPLPPGTGTVTIPLTRRAPYYQDAGVRLSLLVSGDTRLHVQFVTDGGVVEPDERQPLDLRRAPYRLFVRLPQQAAVTAVRLSVDNRTTGLCVLGSEIDVVGPG